MINKIVSRVAKSLAYTALGLAILAKGLDVPSRLNDYYHSRFPSPQREAFEEKFGFPIKGWTEDIEEDKDNLRTIVHALEKEKARGDLNLKAIIVESNNPFKRSVDQNIKRFSNPHIGIYYPGEKEIYLKNDSDSKLQLEDTVSHEVKHHKTFTLEAKQPVLSREFKEKWLALTKDKDGNSLYLPPASPREIVHRLDKETKMKYSELCDLGFVSPYARVDFLEDVAKLCSEAEVVPVAFYRLHMKHPIILEKAKLAAQYGLVPNELFKFFELMQAYDLEFNCKGKDKYLNDDHEEEKCDQNKGMFVELSNQFLAEHPDTVYKTQILVSQGLLMEDYALRGERYTYDQVINQFETLLKSRSLSQFDCSQILGSLQRDYSKKGDSKRSKIYGDLGKYLEDPEIKGRSFYYTDEIVSFLNAHGEKIN